MLPRSILVPCTFLFLSNCIDVDEQVLDDEPALGEAEGALAGSGGDGEPDCTIPATPTLAVQSTTANSVTLLAQSSCDNAGSAIERRLGASGSFVRLANPPLWGTPYVDAGRAAQTQYCYRVIANIGTNTRTSTIHCATTKMAPPIAPYGVAISEITGSTMELRFQDDSTNEDGFRVYHRNSVGSYDAPMTIATTSKTSAGTTYYVPLTPTGNGTGHGTHCYLVNAFHADGQAWGAEVCAKLQNLADPPEEAVEWFYGQNADNGNDEFTPRVAGSLQNGGASASLKYAYRYWGVSLGWDAWEIPNDFEFERSPGASLAPIVDGELIAIKVRGGGYLKYEQRDWGINLGFSSTPRYEWRLRRSPGFYGDREGYPMFTGEFAISNSVANDFLVYGSRSNGVSLKWFRDTGVAQPPPPGMQLITDSISLDAGNQNNWVIWQGAIGGSNDHGVLQKIALPSTTNLAGFFFLKGSAGGDKCMTADSASGVFVRKGEAMNEGQKMTLWGTATPSIPLTLRGCACIGTNCAFQPTLGETPPPAIVNVEWIAN